MDYDPESETENQAFATALTEASLDRTISEALVSMADKTSVKIISVTKMNAITKEDYTGVSRLTVLAEYKDGLAFTAEERFSNGRGTKHHYFLQRNDESQAYQLTTKQVLEKDHPALKQVD